MDMTSIWVAEHGWVYLNAIIDCCTREIVGSEVSMRGRAQEAIAVIQQPVVDQQVAPGTAVSRQRRATTGASRSPAHPPICRVDYDHGRWVSPAARAGR